MSKVALIITDRTDIATNATAVFEFIDYSVAVAEDLSSLKAQLNSDNDFLIALICIADADAQKQLITHVNRELASLPIYLLNPKNGTNPSPGIIKGITGTLSYPIHYKDLLSRVRRAEQDTTGRGDNTSLSTTLTGNSTQIKSVEALIRHVSMTDANVLLLGESGTGKEVVARGIHHLSLRTTHPFVAVNCGAIPPELLESELFGHEKGAFTGAINFRRGRFELAEGGTLFLDEIGDMPMPMQVKLLRVLQERSFERVGGTKTIMSNVRLIAATHQDLEKRIGEGKFRMDLYYRLNVFPIELPPIRDRPDDIPLLVEKFCNRMEIEHRSPIEFDESALKALASHTLEGNVRELENLVERLAILYPGETISNEKLPQRYRYQSHGANGSAPSPETAALQTVPQVSNLDTDEVIDLKQHLTSIEKSIILNALENADWVVAKAAKSLALQRTTLIQKIRKLDIQSTNDQNNYYH